MLLKGSPTKKFQVRRGLHQGDLMSHFLYIIVMEALYISIEDVYINRCFVGSRWGCSVNDATYVLCQ